MDKKFVTIGVFKELISSGGISKVVAQKDDTERYSLFGLSSSQSTAYLVKSARGVDNPRKWHGLGYLGDFIEATGASEFTVIGLLNDDNKNTKETR